MKKSGLLFGVAYLLTLSLYGSIYPNPSGELDSYLTRCSNLGYFSGAVLIAKEGRVILNKG
jgi:hypothetical protein